MNNVFVIDKAIEENVVRARTVRRYFGGDKDPGQFVEREPHRNIAVTTINTGFPAKVIVKEAGPSVQRAPSFMRVLAAETKMRQLEEHPATVRALARANTADQFTIRGFLALLDE